MTTHVATSAWKPVAKPSLLPLCRGKTRRDASSPRVYIDGTSSEARNIEARQTLLVQRTRGSIVARLRSGKIDFMYVRTYGHTSRCPRWSSQKIVPSFDLRKRFVRGTLGCGVYGRRYGKLRWNSVSLMAVWYRSSVFVATMLRNWHWANGPGSYRDWCLFDMPALLLATPGFHVVSRCSKLKFLQFLVSVCRFWPIVYNDRSCFDIETVNSIVSYDSSFVKFQHLSLKTW